MKKDYILDNKKAILLIIVVLIAGLLVGSAVTGEAVKRRRLIIDPGDGPGGVATIEIRDGDLITKGNYLFVGDGICNNSPNDNDCWKFGISELYSGGGFYCINNETHSTNCTGVNFTELNSGKIGNIFQNEFPKGPTIQIKSNFQINNSSNNPIGIGECTYLLPHTQNKFVRICLEKFTVLDYNTYQVRFVNSEDLSSGGTPTQTSEPVIEISPLGGLEDGLILKDINSRFLDYGPGFNRSSKVYTDKILLHKNDTTPSMVDFFYKDAENRIKWAGSAIPPEESGSTFFGLINYKNTTGRLENNLSIKSIALQISMRAKPTQMKLIFNYGAPRFNNLGSGEGDLYLSLNNGTFVYPNNETFTNILNFTCSLPNNTAFLGFGTCPGMAELNELTYRLVSSWYYKNPIGTYEKDPTFLGTKTNDLRTEYGVIVRNPYLYLSSDVLTLEVPADQVKVKTVIQVCDYINLQPVCHNLSKNVPLNLSFNYNVFDSRLNASHISNLQNTYILFGSEYYKVHDEIDLGVIYDGTNKFFEPIEINNLSGPRIGTSLTSRDYSYGTDVFLEFPRKKSVTYSYLFDQITPLNTTSNSKPLVINLLGKTLRIVKISSDKSFIIEKIPQ